MLKFAQNIVGILFITLAISACTKSGAEDQAEDGFIAIFNGENLDGWEGDTAYWRVENGILTGEITPDKKLASNTFLIWEDRQTEDFELKVAYRISKKGNSGINYRSERLSKLPYALRGYQADIDGKNNYTGQNYEERGRTTLAYRGQKVLVSPFEGDPEHLRNYVKKNAWTLAKVTASLGDKDSLRSVIKMGDWNEVQLIVKDNRLQHYINGILMSDVTDRDTVNGRKSGRLGFQVHVGPPMKVEFSNIQYKEL
ncbi:MAG: DUF1080 domain-containing protein [Fulvivirga sp.]